MVQNLPAGHGISVDPPRASSHPQATRSIHTKSAQPPLISNPSTFPWRIFALTAILIIVWIPFVTWTGWRADLAESNLQANLIRITRYLRTSAPDTVLVGSSVGGRLLPDDFQAAGLNVLNLGLDGSRPLFGFEVLHEHSTLPKRVLLDTSTLFQSLQPNDVTLREAMQSPTAQLSKPIPFFRPELRPASVLYEKIKGFRDRTSTGRKAIPLREKSDSSPASELPETYGAVREQIQSLLAAGVEVILLDIPRGPGWAEPLSGGPSAHLASELHLPVLQPGPAIHARDGDVLRYSDGLHLDAPSATRVTQWIATELKK